MFNIKENPVWAANSELEKQKNLESAYKKMENNIPVTPEEDAALQDYISVIKKLNATKIKNDAHEAYVNSNSFKAASVLKKIETEEKAKTEEVKEASRNNFMPAQVTPVMGKDITPEDALMYSLIKDTPSGVYNINMAKSLAEKNIENQLISEAHKRVSTKADQTFEELMKNDTELSHPDVAPEAKNYFNVLKQFSPALAANPLTLKSFINKSRSYGGIDEKQIQGLIQLNNDYLKNPAIVY